MGGLSLWGQTLTIDKTILSYYSDGMARPLRIEYPGAWYHITCRGNEKKEIFSNDHDRIKFLEILATDIKLYGIEVHAYILMDNHFHLLLMTSEANLKNFMQRFNTTYTVYYNRRRQRSGHLYQGRYKAILIDADGYLLELSRYLHLNPVRVKKYSQLTVKEKQKIIYTYPWSSYGGYIHLRNRQPFVNYSKVLAMLGRRDDREGRKRYEEFVMAGILKDANITIWEGVRGQAVLGSDKFVDWIYDRFLAKTKIDNKELPGLKDLQIGPSTMEEIAREVALEFDVPAAELYRLRAACRLARSVFMELCYLYLTRKMGLAQIGRKLGGLSAAALSQNRRRLAAKMQDDYHLRQSFQKLIKVWSRDL